MQSTTALRIAARSVARRHRLPCSSRVQQRSLATAAPTHAEHHSTSSSTPASATKAAPIALSNVEAKWAGLSEAEQAAVHEQLEVIQQKDWKELSVDEKKAGALCFPLTFYGCHSSVLSWATVRPTSALHFCCYEEGECQS